MELIALSTNVYHQQQDHQEQLEQQELLGQQEQNKEHQEPQEQLVFRKSTRTYQNLQYWH